MKKGQITTIILLGAIVALVGLQSHTTTFSGNTYPKHTSSDTMTNATTDTMTMDVVGWHADVSFAFDFTKITGTAGGTISVYASRSNGARYALVTTLSISTATTQEVQWDVLNNPYTNYMFVVRDTGTQLSAVKGWLLVRG